METVLHTPELCFKAFAFACVSPEMDDTRRRSFLAMVDECPVAVDGVASELAKTEHCAQSGLLNVAVRNEMVNLVTRVLRGGANSSYQNNEGVVHFPPGLPG